MINTTVVISNPIIPNSNANGPKNVVPMPPAVDAMSAGQVVEYSLGVGSAGLPHDIGEHVGALNQHVHDHQRHRRGGDRFRSLLQGVDDQLGAATETACTAEASIIATVTPAPRWRRLVARARWRTSPR
jgi:hypothetical protein